MTLSADLPPLWLLRADWPGRTPTHGAGPAILARPLVMGWMGAVNKTGELNAVGSRTSSFGCGCGRHVVRGRRPYLGNEFGVVRHVPSKIAKTVLDQTVGTSHLPGMAEAEAVQ